MDKDTVVSLHRSKVGPSAQSEYFMMEAGRKVGPQEIEDMAKRLGIHGQPGR